MTSTLRFAMPILGLLLPLTTHAAIEISTLAICSQLADPDKRLACFDRLSAGAMKQVDPVAPAVAVPAPALLKADEPATRQTSLLAQEWELGNDLNRGTYNFRPYRANYLLLANYSGAPNYAPFKTAAGDAGLEGRRIKHAELTFQLGFKMKMVENVAGSPFDLWFGYTQQSYWQAFNKMASSPFRETNYQPEVMAVVPVNFRLPGMTARFLNFGVVHQSNGQTGTLSRSWNRAYAQIGLEEGGFTVLARVWKRLDGGGTDDDNPDIIAYMGHGDIQADYRQGGHDFSIVARQNFSTNRGAAQLGWAFPLTRNLKGYVQAFTGYGQTLIDYNYSHKSIGAGVTVDF
ncbi:phospholipase A [Actimicrobium antarcticum]|uniref:Phospholipase A1 n=1 Tax=Actimicrobium antarcticum TaxID=1051899 RepID=A0ABP7TWP2_9BURK